MVRLADEHAETHAAEVASGRAPSSPGVASGEVLAGRYQLIEMLGAGGMGTVYRARDLELDELVALKTLRRELIEAPGALERFRRELKLARRVTHRSVARAFDLGEHAGERFLTMEFVPGPSLGRVLEERGALPPAEAARIAIGICEGLAAAHAAGVVHRDLKPDNVLLDGERVVITDFGVARATTSDDPRATAAGGIVGTPAYMAPEQVEGADVDARADLYALGVLLFEAIAGRLPFEGRTPLALAAARLVGRAPPLGSVAPTCPSALTEIVDRALSRLPESRFASADAMRVALEAVLRAPAPAPGARGPTAAPPRPAAERRLAVVPLRTAGAGEDAWIAEGLADDLVDALSLVRGLRVRGRTPAPTRDEDLRLYGRRHDVEVLVDGSVRREGERVRTHLRLVSIADGFQIWARRFDSGIGELLRVGDEAAHAIAEALAGTENATPVQATTNPEAVELYLRAKRATDITPGRRYELVTRALELAPDDPTMLAAYARWAADGAFEPGSDPGLAERAMDAARRALAMAPALPDAHLALARVHNARDDDEAAMRAVLEARRIGPGMADPDDLLGRFLAECDLVREARAHLERALWIDPTQHAAMVDLLRCFALERRWDDVTSRLETLRTAQPLYYALIASRMWLWGAPVSFDSEIEHVHPVMRRFDAHMRHIVRTGGLAPTFDADVAEMCAQVPPVSRPRRLFRQVEAECRAFVGDTRGALEAVVRSVDAGLRDLAWMRRCPLLGSVRSLPAFPALLATVEARVAPRIALYRAAAVPIALPAA